MGKIIGRQEEVGLGLESVRGTVVVPTKFMRKTVFSVLPKIEQVIDESVRNVLGESEGARITKKWWEGALEGNLDVDGIGYFLKNLLGTVNSTVVSGAVKSHAFTFLESIEHPTLTIVRKDSAIRQEAYSGAVVSSLEIDATPEKIVSYSAEFIAFATGANATSPTYSATNYDFIGRDYTVKIADTEAGLAGASAIIVKGVNIKINNSPINDFNLGSYNPVTYNGPFVVDIEINKNFEDTTYEDLWKAGTYKYMSITIEGEAILATTYKPTITFVLNRTRIMDWERSSDNSALAEEKLSVKAFYNNTDSEQVAVTVQNLTATY
jgi:hypothetical protein